MTSLVLAQTRTFWGFFVVVFFFFFVQLSKNKKALKGSQNKFENILAHTSHKFFQNFMPSFLSSGLSMSSFHEHVTSDVDAARIRAPGNAILGAKKRK